MQILNGHFEFPNLEHNIWLDKYNRLVGAIYTGTMQFPKCVRIGIHHILPRSTYPEYTNDPRNHIWLPFAEHMNLHYYLWKYKAEYAAQLWFGCVYGRKHGLWNLPGGDIEYMQLKQDLAKSRQAKKLRTKQTQKGENLNVEASDRAS